MVFHPVVKLLSVTFAAALVALGCGSPRDCVPDPKTDPDYADPAAWGCRPDVEGDACDVDLTAVEVLPDGSTQIAEHVPAADPAVDCFYVYPTVDLDLQAGLHQDVTDSADALRTIGIQGARFGEVCRVFAPLYRQVQLGTYLARENVRDLCFDAAYADVLAAFERYLANDNQGRGFLLIGHSQGAQITSRLLRERIEGDAGLRARLVAAFPIGWPIGTDAGGLTGGSFSSVPVCTSADEVGCAVGYRSFAEGNAFPTENDDFFEGEQGVCVHPGDVAAGGPAPLSRSYFPSDLEGNSFPSGVAGQAPFVLYRDMFEARCAAEGKGAALEVRAAGGAGDTRVNPLDFEAPLVSGATGTHIYDVQLGLGDLIDLAGAKAAAYSAAK